MIQLDYTFLSTKGVTGESTGQQTLLTLIDVRSQLAAATIVPYEGVNSYAITEAKRFLYEVLTRFYRLTTRPPLKRLQMS